MYDLHINPLQDVQQVQELPPETTVDLPVIQQPPAVSAVTAVPFAISVAVVMSKFANKMVGVIASISDGLELLATVLEREAKTIVTIAKAVQEIKSSLREISLDQLEDLSNRVNSDAADSDDDDDDSSNNDVSLGESLYASSQTTDYCRLDSLNSRD